RKNVPLVIQTLARLRQQTDAYLLQVGGRFPPEQEQLIERLDLRSAVRSVSSADETALRRAYRAADVLLFPSLYAGFGFPVLEAFASGLPVVTSGAGGLKETGGNAAVHVEGRDPAAYVEALNELANDELAREALIERGAERAREYTWQRTADLTAEVYRKLMYLRSLAVRQSAPLNQVGPRSKGSPFRKSPTRHAMISPNKSRSRLPTFAGKYSI